MDNNLHQESQMSGVEYTYSEVAQNALRTKDAFWFSRGLNKVI